MNASLFFFQQCSRDGIEYKIQRFLDLFISESNRRNAVVPHKFIPPRIINFCFGRTMDPSINFDHEFCFGAVKVRDEWTDTMLSPELIVG